MAISIFLIGVATGILIVCAVLGVYFSYKVLLAEYASAHDSSLAPEGAAMLSVLSRSFERCGYDVVVPGNGDFGAEIGRLAPSCDMGLVIAPDHLLARFTQILEQHTHNLGLRIYDGSCLCQQDADRKDPAFA